MFTVIGLMLGGMAIGFLLRHQEFSWINKVITSLIWVLLFLLGVLGSCIFAWGLWYLLYKKKGGKA